MQSIQFYKYVCTFGHFQITCGYTRVDKNPFVEFIFMSLYIFYPVLKNSSEYTWNYLTTDGYFISYFRFGFCFFSSVLSIILSWVGQKLSLAVPSAILQK